MSIDVIAAECPGPPTVLRPSTAALPHPGPSQVRVRVLTAGVTFADVLTRQGSPLVPAAEFPTILGNSVGGIVEAVGDNVSSRLLGAVVATSTGGSGGYASHTLASAADVHRVPPYLPIEDATALLADGRTALGMHRAAHVGKGETVVVTAAAGGVGGLLIQLAKLSGANVAALAGSQRKLVHARTLGADIAHDYRQAGWEHHLAKEIGQVDVLFDGVGGRVSDRLLALMSDGARLISYGAAGGQRRLVNPDLLPQRGITFVDLSALRGVDHFQLIEQAFALHERGLRVPIGQHFPLTKAAEAHALMESRGTIGKTILHP